MIPVADDMVLWRERAAEARRSARQMGDDRCRRTLLGIAESYECMAQLAERRLARRRAIAGASRIAFGCAGLVGGGAGWALGYLLRAATR